MLTTIHIFRPELRNSKKKEEGKNGRKNNDGTKDERLKLLIDGEIEFEFR